MKKTLISRKWFGEILDTGIAPLVYLVCLRAVITAVILASAWPDDAFRQAFGGNIITATMWGCTAAVIGIVCIIGVALKRGHIVTSSSMVMFVLWLYLIFVYLSQSEFAFALVESFTALLFAYFYISVCVNRKWGCVPHYTIKKGT